MIDIDKMNINGVANVINTWAEAKGWNKDLRNDIDNLAKQLMNLHSEVTEAWEELRNGKEIYDVYYNGEKPEGFTIELADLAIRLLHICAFYGINLEYAIKLKMRYNETREYRHGGKKA